MASYMCGLHDKLMMAQACPDCIKALVEAASRLLDMCHFLTPQIIYLHLGDDAAVAAGLPLLAAQSNDRPFTPVDLSWAEDAIAAFKDSPDA